MINLRGVDLNLLPGFEAVYEERSFTKAADRLAMSQPAVSNAVARLRSVFNDELFVRHARGFSLTRQRTESMPRCTPRSVRYAMRFLTNVDSMRGQPSLRY